MKRFASSQRRNFSLIEILTVIAIIGVLTAIALGLMSLAKTKMAESRTRATIEKVSLALNSLQSKFGYFPNSQGGMLVISTKGIEVEKLQPDDVDLGYLNGSKDSIYPKAYLKGFISIMDFDNLKSSCIAFDGKIVLADTMLRPMLYRSPGVHNTSTFDLVSAGVDGNVGETTDPLLTSDQKINVAFDTFDMGGDNEKSEVQTNAFKPKTSDDIANF